MQKCKLKVCVIIEAGGRLFMVEAKLQKDDMVKRERIDGKSCNGNLTLS